MKKLNLFLRFTDEAAWRAYATTTGILSEVEQLVLDEDAGRLVVRLFLHDLRGDKIVLNAGVLLERVALRGNDGRVCGGPEVPRGRHAPQHPNGTDGQTNRSLHNGKREREREMRDEMRCDNMGTITIAFKAVLLNICPTNRTDPDKINSLDKIGFTQDIASKR